MWLVDNNDGGIKGSFTTVEPLLSGHLWDLAEMSALKGVLSTQQGKFSHVIQWTISQLD